MKAQVVTKLKLSFPQYCFQLKKAILFLNYFIIRLLEGSFFFLLPLLSLALFLATESLDFLPQVYWNNFLPDKQILISSVSP